MVILSNDITYIPEECFMNCINLKYIIYEGLTINDETDECRIFLSGYITNIGKNAFTGCSSLAEIVIPIGFTNTENIPENINIIQLSAIQTDATYEDAVIINHLDINAYFSSDELLYSTESKKIEWGDNIDNNSLVNIKIKEGITELFRDSFKGCTSLQKVILPNTLTSAYAPFTDCPNLKDIKLGSSLLFNDTNNGSSFIDNAVNLTSECIHTMMDDLVKNKNNMNTNYGVTSYENSFVLTGNNNVTYLNIPDGIDNIHIENCNNLKYIRIPKMSYQTGVKDTGGLGLLRDMMTDNAVLSEVWYDGDYREAFTYYDQDIKDECFQPTEVTVNLDANNCYINNTDIQTINNLWDNISTLEPVKFFARDLEADTTGKKWYYILQTSSKQEIDNSTTITSCIQPSDDAVRYVRNGYSNEYTVSHNTIPSKYLCIDTSIFTQYIKCANSEWTQFAGAPLSEKLTINNIDPLTGRGVIDVAVKFNEYSITTIKYILIGDSITDINTRAFFGNPIVEAIKIGKNVENIADGVFGACGCLRYKDGNESNIKYYNKDYNKLLQFVVDSDNQNISANDDTLYDIKNSKLIFSQTFDQDNEICKYNYIETNARSGYAQINIINPKLPDTCITLGDSTFEKCNNLKSITIGTKSALTNINDYVFMDCYNLESIELPSSVSHIGVSAFRNCVSLTEINLQDTTINDIYDYTFKNCYKLTDVILPSTLKTIGDNAFWYNYSLTEINIPDSVISIESGAFCGCYRLKTVKIGTGIRTLNAYAFLACPITTLTMHKQVKIISMHTMFGHISPYDINDDGKYTKENYPLNMTINYDGTSDEFMSIENINTAFCYYGIKSLTINCTDKIGTFTKASNYNVYKDYYKLDEDGNKQYDDNGNVALTGNKYVLFKEIIDASGAVVSKNVTWTDNPTE